MTECPNGCDLEEFGGTHQGLPDCDLKPSNPDHRGRFGMTDDEKKLIREAASLLATGTCNSLFPENIAGWRRERDRIVIALREAAR